jgi:hypothetical protein
MRYRMPGPMPSRVDVDTSGSHFESSSSKGLCSGKDSGRTVGFGGRGSPSVPLGPLPRVSGPQRAADAAARRRGDRGRGESKGDAGGEVVDQ